MKVIVQPGRAICKGGSLIKEGTVLEMPDEEAIQLCANGVVGKVAPPKPKKKAAKKKAEAPE